jgi:hypothetical protein
MLVPNIYWLSNQLGRRTHGQQPPGSEDVGAGNRTRVPCVEKEGNGLQSNTDRVTLVGHYLEAFYEVSMHLLNHHGVIIVAQKTWQLIHSRSGSSRQTP